MEVHHHAHTARKKWTHYFWEFLMLFLAVFCGFLAEMKLEHTIEHQREKQFMQSMVEDLQTDTADLPKAIRKAERIVLYSDSSLQFLLTYQIADSIPMRLANYIGYSGIRLDWINTDRTSSQLKNAGAMRLIRKKDVSDSILRYWKQIEETRIGIERYMIYRDASRALAFRLWVIPEVYRNGLKMTTDSIRSLRVIDKDPKKWDELANLTAINGTIVRNVHTRNLEQQLSMATHLIQLIRKEYNLKE